MTDTSDRGEPIIRVVPRISDLNSNGHIFGGWVLSQMDIAGGVVAHRAAGGPVATVAIDSMAFIAPIHVHDLVSIHARIVRRGRTSLRIALEVVAERYSGEGQVRVTEGLFSFVAIDEQGQPRPLPPA